MFVIFHSDCESWHSSVPEHLLSIVVLTPTDASRSNVNALSALIMFVRWRFDPVSHLGEAKKTWQLAMDSESGRNCA
jgi:hypothetical protein